MCECPNIHFPQPVCEAPKHDLIKLCKANAVYLPAWAKKEIRKKAFTTYEFRSKPIMNDYDTPSRSRVVVPAVWVHTLTIRFHGYESTFTNQQ